MVRPSPMPCVASPAAGVMRWNGSNILARFPSAMPGPVSLTSKSITSPGIRTANLMCPCSVNFKAFDNRLIRIWRSRISSVNTLAGRLAGAVVDELNPLGRGLEPEHVGNLAEKLDEPDLTALDLDPPGLDFGNIHQAFDQPMQMLAAAPDGANGFAPMRRDRRVNFEKLGVAQNRVQRRAQLMANAHNKTGFGEIRGFGHFPCARQFGPGAPMCGDFSQQ